MKLEILFEDNHLLVINKPIGILVQGDKTALIDLLVVLLCLQELRKPWNV